MRVWLIAAILACMACAAYAQSSEYSAAVLSDHPLAYYRLNEQSGTIARDSSGNGRDAIYRNGVTLGASGALGSSDTAASFNGLTNYIQVPGPWGGSNWKEVTIEAWVNLHATSNDIQAIVISPDAGQFVHFQMSNAVFTYFNVIYPNIFLPIIPETPIFQWRHVVLVGKSGESRIYVNGQQMGPGGPGFPPVTITDPITQIAAASEVRIGGNYFGQFGTGRFLNGSIDEVAIYDHALSASQVLAHYTARSDAPIVTCVPNATTACMLNGRFRATVRYRGVFDNNPADTNAFVKSVTGFSDPNFETAFFYFNSQNNIEVLLKLLDQGNKDSLGRPTIAVLFGSSTPLRIELTLVDTHTGATKQYTSQFGSQAGATDFTAFVK